MSQIDQHWAWLFGISLSDYQESPLTVTAHNSPFFEGYNGAWIYECQGRWVLTVPPVIRDAIHTTIRTIPPEMRHTEKGVKMLFGDRVGRVVGPTFQGAATDVDFKPYIAFAARPLEPSDRLALERLLDKSDPEQVDHSGVRPDSQHLFGCYLDGQLLSVAKTIELSPYASTIGVLTHPNFRGQGFGKAVVSAAMSSLFSEGKCVVYQTLESNTPSVALAQSLGCRNYARHTAVRFV